MTKAVDLLNLIAWTVGVILLGTAACFLMVNYLPLIWGGGLAILFVLCFLVAVLARQKFPAIAFYPLIGVLYSLAFAGVLLACTGIERVEEFPCTWKLDPADANCVLVDLSSIGGFARARVTSAELVEHLAKENPANVNAGVEITRDFGQLRSRGKVVTVDGFPVKERS